MPSGRVVDTRNRGRSSQPRCSVRHGQLGLAMAVVEVEHARRQLGVRCRHRPQAAARRGPDPPVTCRRTSNGAPAATGSASIAMHAQPAQLQVRRDQAGQAGTGQQQAQQQRGIVVVVERADGHHQQQAGVEQPETRRQHVHAAAVELHRQRLGLARPGQRHQARAHAARSCDGGDCRWVGPRLSPPAPRAGSTWPRPRRCRRRHRQPGGVRQRR